MVTSHIPPRIEIARGYDQVAFREDLKKLLIGAGGKGRGHMATLVVAHGRRRVLSLVCGRMGQLLNGFNVVSTCKSFFWDDIPFIAIKKKAYCVRFGSSTMNQRG